MTRTEHLAWCKKRALEFVEMGDLQQAFASMVSDILKHPETEHHVSTNSLGMSLNMAGQLNTEQQMRDWIEGYN